MHTPPIPTLLGVLCLLIGAPAHAESIAAAPSPTERLWRDSTWVTTPRPFNELVATLCSRFVTWASASATWSGAATPLTAPSAPATQIYIDCEAIYWNGTTGWLSPVNPATAVGPVYSCPLNQNWTLSGTACVRADCGATEIRNPSTGICETQCSAGQTWHTGSAQCLCQL